MDYVKDQNHTDGDGTGAVMLSYNAKYTMVEVGCISYIGFEVPIPAKTLKGKNYYITAWLKNKEERSPLQRLYYLQTTLHGTQSRLQAVRLP